MEDSIKSWCKEHGLVYIIIPNKSLKIIHDLLINNIFGKPKKSMEFHYFGKYYELQKKYDLMRKYYIKAIKNKYINSMYTLANYYANSVDHDQMIKYLKMASELGHSRSTCELGCHYRKQEKYDLMKKYLLIAIKQENIMAMINLANYYSQYEKSHQDAEKYFLMAIVKGSTLAIEYLALFHYNQKRYNDAERYWLMALEKDDHDIVILFNLGLCCEKQREYDKMHKYLSIAIEKGDMNAMMYLGRYYEEKGDNEQAVKYFLMVAQKDNDSIDDIINYCLNKNHRNILIELYDKLNLKDMLLDEANCYLKENTLIPDKITEIISNLLLDYPYELSLPTNFVLIY